MHEKSLQMDHLVQQVLRKSPRVSRIIVTSGRGTYPIYVPSFFSGMALLVSQLGHLKEARIGSSDLAVNILEHLVETTNPSGLKNKEVTAKVAPAFTNQLQRTKNPFAKLSLIKLNIQVEHLVEFLHSHPACFELLESLDLTIVKATSSQQVQALCHAIAKYVPGLKSLNIEESNDWLSYRVSHNRKSTPAFLTSESLSELQYLTSLNKLVLHINSPWSISDKDVVSLVKNIPDLACLDIACTPQGGSRVFMPSKLTLGLLSALSLQPNQLQFLHVQLDPQQLVEVNEKRLDELPTGPHLQKLVDLGFSNWINGRYYESMDSDNETEPVRQYLERCLTRSADPQVLVHAYMSFKESRGMVPKYYSWYTAVYEPRNSIPVM